jgi:hypothetical protein
MEGFWDESVGMVAASNEGIEDDNEDEDEHD